MCMTRLGRHLDDMNLKPNALSKSGIEFPGIQQQIMEGNQK
jgi:hypothetical protein